MCRFLVLIFFFTTSICRGEYRVFELEITAYSEPDKTVETQPGSPPPAPEELGKRTVLSTLDPEQYRGYHTVQPNEQIRYIATWRCPGRTSFKDYCPNPKVKTEESSAPATSENK